MVVSTCIFWHSSRDLCCRARMQVPNYFRNTIHYTTHVCASCTCHYWSLRTLLHHTAFLFYCAIADFCVYSSIRLNKICGWNSQPIHISSLKAFCPTIWMAFRTPRMSIQRLCDSHLTLHTLHIHISLCVSSDCLRSFFLWTRFVPSCAHICLNTYACILPN